MRKMRRRLVACTLMIALLVVVPSAWAATRPRPADDEPSDVATLWVDTLYDVVKAEAVGFPVAARIYGVSAVALYEAIVPGTLAHRSLVGQLDGLTSVPQPTAGRTYHWPTVANAVLARTIRGISPALESTSVQAINALEQRLAAQFSAEVEEQAYQRSVSQGQRVADAAQVYPGPGAALLGPAPADGPEIGRGVCASSAPCILHGPGFGVLCGRA
jgi:hypothetical protein